MPCDSRDPVPHTRLSMPCDSSDPVPHTWLYALWRQWPCSSHMIVHALWQQWPCSSHMIVCLVTAVTLFLTHDCPRLVTAVTPFLTHHLTLSYTMLALKLTRSYTHKIIYSAQCFCGRSGKQKGIYKVCTCTCTYNYCYNIIHVPVSDCICWLFLSHLVWMTMFKSSYIEQKETQVYWLCNVCTYIALWIVYCIQHVHIIDFNHVYMYTQFPGLLSIFFFTGTTCINTQEK
jgi:hypothetical protein